MIARPHEPVPVGTRVAFDLPRPVASSKNRRRIFARRGRVRSLPSEQATNDRATIACLALAAARGIEFGPDDALRLDYEHDIESDVVRVCVTKIGELPSRNGRLKRGTKRDVHGMLETIADALQGVLFENDNQIDAGGYRRKRE